jgi:hypothetical protein
LSKYFLAIIFIYRPIYLLHVSTVKVNDKAHFSFNLSQKVDQHLSIRIRLVFQAADLEGKTDYGSEQWSDKWRLNLQMRQTFSSLSLITTQSGSFFTYGKWDARQKVDWELRSIVAARAEKNKNESAV